MGPPGFAATTTTTTLPPTTTTTLSPTTTTTAPPATTTTVTAPAPFNFEAAIDACPAGGTVTIPAGTWTVTDQINLKSGITIQGQGDISVIKLVGGTDWTRVLFGSRLANVTLRDFKVDGNAASAVSTGNNEQRHCIFLTACSDSLIERVTVTQPLGDGIFLYGGAARITVRDCVAIAGTTANPRVGINFQGANDCLITGNRVEGFVVAYKAELDTGDPDSVGVRIVGNTCSAVNPLALNGKPSGKCRNYLIEGNTFVATGTYAMWISGSRNCIIRGNTLTGGIGIYLCFDNQGLLIEGNTIAGVGDCDVYLGEIYNLGPSTGIRITGNTFPAGSHNQGIIFHIGTTVTNVEIDHNTYPSGATLYHPYGGASANVHDNVAE